MSASCCWVDSWRCDGRHLHGDDWRQPSSLQYKSLFRQRCNFGDEVGTGLSPLCQLVVTRLDLMLAGSSCAKRRYGISEFVK